MKYTIKDVINEFNKQTGKMTTTPTIINIIKQNNFYNRGLAYKEQNGFITNDNKHGTIWFITNEGKDEIIEVLMTRKRFRRTKQQMLEEKEKNNYIATSFEIRKNLKEQVDVYLNIMGITQKDYINDLIEYDMKSKNTEIILKQLNEWKKVCLKKD